MVTVSIDRLKCWSKRHLFSETGLWPFQRPRHQADSPSFFVEQRFSVFVGGMVLKDYVERCLIGDDERMKSAWNLSLYLLLRSQ